MPKCPLKYLLFWREENIYPVRFIEVYYKNPALFAKDKSYIIIRFFKPLS